MPRKTTEELLARRRTRATFEKAQVRKIFTLPEQLVNVIERACDRFDVTESEFIRRLLLVYALDAHVNGFITQSLQDIWAPFNPPALDATEERDLRQWLAEIPGESVLWGALNAMEGAQPDETHAISRDYMMEHLDEFLAAVDREREKRAREAGATMPT